jgi:hypothetical protein
LSAVGLSRPDPTLSRREVCNTTPSNFPGVTEPDIPSDDADQGDQDPRNGAWA